MEMSEVDDELGSLDTLFIGGKGSRLINSELVGGTMSVGGDGSFLTDKMFIVGAEFLLTTSLVSLMTHGSAPRVDQPLSISLGKFDGIGVARPDVYLSNLFFFFFIFLFNCLSWLQSVQSTCVPVSPVIQHPTIMPCILMF